MATTTTNGCPSGLYLSEIVTGSGLTPQNPTKSAGQLVDWSGSESDYAEWDALATTMIGRLERSWLDFKTWPATARYPTELYNGFVNELNAVREGYARLRKPWTNSSSAFGDLGWYWGIAIPSMAWDSTTEVGQLVQIILDAQCLRQRLDGALAEMRGSPATPANIGKPKVELGILGAIGYAAAGTAVLAGFYFAARAIGGRK